MSSDFKGFLQNSYENNFLAILPQKHPEFLSSGQIPEQQDQGHV